MNEIQQFLSSPNPDLHKGIALLEIHGRKPFLPRTLRRIVASAPKKVLKTLTYELGELEKKSQQQETRSKGKGTITPSSVAVKKQPKVFDGDRKIEIHNDADKLKRISDPVTKEINRRMKALYDESQLLKWTKQGEDTQKEERKHAAFRIIEIHKKLLPPLYDDRDRYVHNNIKPEWMLKKKADIDLSGLPPVGEMMKAIKNLPTYISKYKDNPRRVDDVAKWKDQLQRYREALGMNGS